MIHCRRDRYCKAHALRKAGAGRQSFSQASNRCGMLPPLGSVAIMLIFAVGAAALAGCGLSDGFGALMVDPAQYDTASCKDLVTESAALAKREVELRNLFDRASQGGGGKLIGTMAYGETYDEVLEKEKLVKRAAARKNCPSTPTYRSDQVIR
jgi:hypothetical protein